MKCEQHAPIQHLGLEGCVYCHKSINICSVFVVRLVEIITRSIIEVRMLRKITPYNSYHWRRTIYTDILSKDFTKTCNINQRIDTYVHYLMLRLNLKKDTLKFLDILRL